MQGECCSWGCRLIVFGNAFRGWLVIDSGVCGRRGRGLQLGVRIGVRVDVRVV